MRRRLIGALVVLAIGASPLWLTTATASAAVRHGVPGSYDAYITFRGDSQPTDETMVLLRNHKLGPQGSITNGTWMSSHGEVTVRSESGTGFENVLVGPKTPAGIASSLQPGTATSYQGSTVVLTAQYYAVRTGPVPKKS